MIACPFHRSFFGATFAATAMLIASSSASAAGEPDQVGGYPTTHILVHVHVDVSVTFEDGRWALRKDAVGGRGVDPQMFMEAQGIADLFANFGVENISLAHTPANPQLAQQLGLDRTMLIEVPFGTDTPALVTALGEFPSHIEHAELDGIGETAAVPNDPGLNQQYGLLNVGQTVSGSPGVAGADINATEAWDITQGSSDVLLAILDAGLDDHVDLDGRTIPGWNVVSNNGDTSDVCISHGTHVSGIAAANGDNGTGIAGVDWNTTVVMVRVLNSCSGNESSAANGLIWAADNGADVINISLQYSSGTSTLLNAVNYARGLGAVIVAAGGNQGFSGGIAYPGRWPETIAVAGFNNRGERWSGSNQGPELTIAGPGEAVYSTIGAFGYAHYSGTSMATPHVSGLACLMLSVNPALTHDDIVTIITETAVDIGDFGFDNDFGHGRIDAAAALQRVVDELEPNYDLDDDGTVGILDLLAVLGQWGPCDGACPADFDDSGEVDILDLLALLGAWG